jgi:hypothetical protein
MFVDTIPDREAHHADAMPPEALGAKQGYQPLPGGMDCRCHAI